MSRVVKCFGSFQIYDYLCTWKLKTINDMERTARMILFDCIEENCPIDRLWIRHVVKGMTRKEKLNWARNNIEPFADGCSANKITRAAKMLLFYLNV